MRSLTPAVVLAAALVAPACGTTEPLTIAGAPSAAAGLCTVTVTPLVQTIPRDGGSFHVVVTGPCQWSATSEADWIAVTHGQGADVGSVTFDVQPNSGGERQGRLRVAGTPVTVTQAGPECSYRVAPDAFDVSAESALLQATVETDPACSWTVSSGTPWIEARTSVGSGPRGVVFAVSEHTGTGEDRQGAITIAGQIVRVVQAAVEPPPCTYVLSGPAAPVAWEGGTVNVAVSTGGHCSWSPVSRDAWITATPGEHTGPGSAQFSVAPNEALARTGRVTIGSTTIAIQQEEAPIECGFDVSLLPATIPADGGTVRLQVSTDPRCSWSASANVGWIQVPAGSRRGSATLSLAVGVNDSFNPRTGRIAVEHTTVTLEQDGIASEFRTR